MSVHPEADDKRKAIIRKGFAERAEIQRHYAAAIEATESEEAKAELAAERDAKMMESFNSSRPGRIEHGVTRAPKKTRY